MKHDLEAVEEEDNWGVSEYVTCVRCLACSCCELKKLEEECPGEWKEEEDA